MSLQGDLFWIDSNQFCLVIGKRLTLLHSLKFMMV